MRFESKLSLPVCQTNKCMIQGVYFNRTWCYTLIKLLSSRISRCKQRYLIRDITKLILIPLWWINKLKIDELFKSWLVGKHVLGFMLLYAFYFIAVATSNKLTVFFFTRSHSQAKYKIYSIVLTYHVSFKYS